MKNIVIAFGVILLCVVIGDALGNQSGGFIVGVILAIVLAKKNWKAGAKKSTWKSALSGQVSPFLACFSFNSYSFIFK